MLTKPNHLIIRVKFDDLNPFIRVIFALGICIVSNFVSSKEKARIDIHVDHSKGYENQFQYAVIIQNFDPGTNCKVLYDVVTKPNKVLFSRFFINFISKKYTS